MAGPDTSRPQGEPKPETAGAQPLFFSTALGENYREFWSNMASTPEGARLAVSGHPFGQYPDERLVDLQGLPVARLVKESLDLDGTQRLLEVGCGIGRLARHLAPWVEEYHGADISPAMCLRAAHRLWGVRNAFFHELPEPGLGVFPGQSFDAVMFQHVLIHLDPPDAEHYLAEAYRVLRPGGKLYAQFYNRRHPQGFDETVHAVDQRLRDGRAQRGRVFCHTSHEVRAIVAQAGFEIDREKSHLEPWRQNRQWWPDNDFFFWLIAVGTRR